MNTRTRRPTRIVLLTAVVAALGAADLWFTVHYMQTCGMVELNPLARALAMHGADGLIALKVGSLVLHGGVLMLLRRCASAEVAAWASVVVMTAVTVHWHGFMASAHEMTSADPAVLASDPTFVRLRG